MTHVVGVSTREPDVRRSRRLPQVLTAGVVVAAAAAFRAAACAIYVFNDEYPIIGNVLTFFRDRTLIPSHFAYPTLFSYLIALPTAIGAALLNASGALPSAGDIGALLNLDSVLAVLPARLTSCTFGVLTVIVVYETGRRFYCERVALVAAIVLGFSALHITYSGYALPDVTMTGFALCSLSFSMAALRTRQQRDVLLASAFAGLTAATKYNGAVVLLPLVVAHLIQLFDERRLTLRHVALDIPWTRIGLVFVAAFLVGSPGWLFRPAAFHNALVYEAGHMQRGHPGFFGMPYIRQIVLLWQWEHTLSLLILSGVAYAAYKRSRQDLLLLAVIVPSSLIIGSWAKQDLHYLLFLYPAFALLAGRLVVDAASACRSRAGKVVFAGTLAAIAAWPLYSAVAEAARQLRPDSRWIAAEWVQNNVAEGGAMVVEEEHSHLPRFFTVEEKQQLLAGDHQTFYRAQLSGTRGYRLIPLQYDPAWLSRVDASYLLVGSDTFDRYFNTPPPPAVSSLFRPFMDRRDTYRAIFDGRSPWVLLKGFDTGKGPRVLLYKHN
jgi:hypothetical protein